MDTKFYIFVTLYCGFSFRVGFLQPNECIPTHPPHSGSSLQGNCNRKLACLDKDGVHPINLDTSQGINCDGLLHDTICLQSGDDVRRLMMPDNIFVEAVLKLSKPQYLYDIVRFCNQLNVSSLYKTNISTFLSGKKFERLTNNIFKINFSTSEAVYLISYFKFNFDIQDIQLTMPINTTETIYLDPTEYGAPTLVYITNTVLWHDLWYSKLFVSSTYMTRPQKYNCTITLKNTTSILILGLAGYFETDSINATKDSYIEISEYPRKRTQPFLYYENYKKNKYFYRKVDQHTSFNLRYHSKSDDELAVFAIPILVLQGGMKIRCEMHTATTTRSPKISTTLPTSASSRSTTTHNPPVYTKSFQTTVDESLSSKHQSKGNDETNQNQGQLFGLVAVIIVLVIIIIILVGILLCKMRRNHSDKKEPTIVRSLNKQEAGDYCEIIMKDNGEIPFPHPKNVKNINLSENEIIKGTGDLNPHPHNLEARYSLEKTVKHETNAHCLETKLPEENDTAYSLEKSVPENRKSVIEMVSNDVYNDSYTPSETTPKSNDQDLNDATDDCRKSVVKMVSNDVYNDSDTASEVSCKSNNNNDAEDSEIATNFRKSDDEMVNNDVYNDDDTIILPQVI